MEKKEVKETLKRSRFRWLIITVGIIAGIWALALVVMQVGLNSKFLMSRLTNTYRDMSMPMSISGT